MASGFVRVVAGVVLLATATGVGAQLNFSDGYKFLQAVKDAKGQEVTDMLAKPGTTIVDTRDRGSGEGALHIVVKRNDAAYVRFLLEHGANPNIRDNRGVTPLMLAVTQNEPGCVAALLHPPSGARKANVNLANGSGETPLIRAVQMRNLDLVRALLKAGADPDQADHIAGLSARDYARNDKRSPALLDAIENTKQPGRAAVSGPTL